MNPNEHYQIVEGRIQTRSLEFHIVDHCNLRCWGCCSLSPISAKALTAPAAMKAELELAKKAIEPNRLKLVGGEPLLHPQIMECIQVARAANISPSLSITTNGFNLLKMPTKFWELVDHLTISLYPTPSLPEKAIQQINELATAHTVELNWKTQNSFVGMDREAPDLIGDETQEIYSKCWLRHRCHLIAHGRFYSCTRPTHFHAVSNMESSPYLQDGIALSSAQDIYQYLIKKEALASCALCLGGNATEQPHRQLNLKEIKTEQSLRQNILQTYAATIASHA